MKNENRIEKLEKRLANIKRLEERADRMSEKYFQKRMKMQHLLAKYRILDSPRKS